MDKVLDLKRQKFDQWDVKLPVLEVLSLKEKDYVVGMEVVSEEKDILFATEKGYGKRVKAVDFRVAHRGGIGVRTIPTNDRNGKVIGLVIVDDNTHILLIDISGKIIRLSPKEVRTMGRQAQGVRLIRLDAGQSLAAVAAISGGSEIEATEPEGAVNATTETQAEQLAEQEEQK